MFYRLNNGKALTAIELTRVKAKSFDKIKELAAHEIFKDALKDGQINRYTNEDIVIKALIMLNCEKPSLKNDFIRPYIISTEITDQMAAGVKTALTRIKYVHDSLVEVGEVKAAKKLYTRTHLISFVPLAAETHKNNVDACIVAGFAKYFFTPEKGVTVSRIYNTHCSSGSNGQYAVEMRDRELSEHWKKWRAE